MLGRVGARAASRPQPRAVVNLGPRLLLLLDRAVQLSRLLERSHRVHRCSGRLVDAERLWVVDDPTPRVGARDDHVQLIFAGIAGPGAGVDQADVPLAGAVAGASALVVI